MVQGTSRKGYGAVKGVPPALCCPTPARTPHVPHLCSWTRLETARHGFHGAELLVSARPAGLQRWPSRWRGTRSLEGYFQPAPPYHCLVMSNIMTTPLQFLYTSRNSASRAISDSA